MHNSIEKNKKIGDLNYFSITTERKKKILYVWHASHDLEMIKEYIKKIELKH